MDAWSECFDITRWRAALAVCDLSADFYAARQRPQREVLPWSHLESGVNTAFLWREYRRAAAAETTADCKTSDCQACGLQATVAACAASLQARGQVPG